MLMRLAAGGRLGAARDTSQEQQTMDDGRAKQRGSYSKANFVYIFFFFCNKCTCRKPNQPQGAGKPRGRAEGPAEGASDSGTGRFGSVWG